VTKRNKEVMAMLTDIAEKEVESAAEAVAQAIKYVDEAQAKYDMLVSYYDDYKQNFESSLQRGLGIHAYQNFQRFFAKLDVAIKGQQEVLNAAKAQLAEQKAHWLACQRKKVSYGVLNDRYDAKALQVESKKAQQQTDEFAMRSTLRHS